ncbi:FHA domain-containing protein [candidate division KSB1 bacterium]|nr:FHA domain-containing protein [candidate division KSB1 bacterium]MBL7093562.1 FHA domain-containing protein [candidate division KSB1 bacterium]
MGLINTIDHALKNLIYSLFWWFIDPLEHERLYGQLVDVIERNLDANDPERLVAPDNFDVTVNNKIFIKHAHSIKKLETVVGDRLQKYVANKDYELSFPKIKILIISSATVSKRNAQIRCWFSTDEDEGGGIGAQQRKYTLKVISGDGQGLSWDLKPGNTYNIGRLSALDICLPFDNISKNHASLYFLSEDNIKLVDEGSANGTFINDETDPIKDSRELQLTDKIKFFKINPIVLTLFAE